MENTINARKMEFLQKNRILLKNFAHKGYWGKYGFSEQERTFEYHEMLELIDEDGFTIESKDFCKPNESSELIRKWIDTIFDEGKEEEWAIAVTVTETRYNTLYSPQRYLERSKTDCEKWEAQQNAEKDKQNRYEKWSEACQWARDHGIPVKTGNNRRATVQENVLKKGMARTWNSENPEFPIGEYAITEYEKKYGVVQL